MLAAAVALDLVAGLGPRSIFLAIMAAYVVQSLVVGALLQRGKWPTGNV